MHLIQGEQVLIAYLRKLDDQNLLSLDEMHPTLMKLLMSARDKMRDHFRGRSAEVATELVEEWKKEKLYPYEGDPKSDVERAERQVFEVVALNVHSYLPGFRESPSKEQQFQLLMLRQAIENSPEGLRRILAGVLDLPVEKRDDLAQLLKRTSLSAIITASKTVANRLDFLKALEYLVFDPQSKEVLLERKQLHKIVEGETLIFGEEFNLTASDQSLTEVLNKHLHILRGPEAHLVDQENTKPLKKKGKAAIQPVLREDGSIGIVDLMLSRRVPQPHADQNEHLIVELKRPSVKIDPTILTQVEEYALAVANDERFKDTNTRWFFWAVSNEVTENARHKARQRERKRGVVFQSEDGRIEVWVKTWGQIIEECRARLELVQRSLKYVADEESALEYLHDIHRKYLPGPALAKSLSKAG